MPETKVNVKPLPTSTKSVLRPYKPSTGTKVAQPLRPPTSIPSLEIRNTDKVEPSDYNELLEASKKAASAETQQPISHTKPKFKQVINTSISSASDSAVNLPTINDLVALLDKEIAERAENEKSSKQVALKNRVDGLEPMLLPHQVKGLEFLKMREHAKDSIRGGILADDMGLGKTIQSIALILANKPGPNAKHKTTLVVTPLAVMDQWKAEIEKMAPKLKVRTHYGPGRDKERHKLYEYDVIITTYQVAVSELKSDGPLMKGRWYRVICDEAHVFRNPKSNTFIAINTLKSNGRRWALTGTPIHNKISDFISLLQFVDDQRFNQSMLEYLEANQQTLRKVIDVLLLRRTQAILGDVLPSIVKENHRLNHISEKDVETEEKIIRNTSLSYNVMLVRLRQAADGLLSIPELMAAKEMEDKKNAEKKTEGKESKVSAGLEADDDSDLARLLGGLSLAKPEKESKEYIGKHNAKVAEIRQILGRDRNRKTVIFSSFVTMLELIRIMLDNEGYNSALYIGSCNSNERAKILDRFKDPNGGITVLLCSLGTAAVGLNLTAASQVIMTEPWWNPQISDQAVKRVHRIGQKHEVTFHELIVRGSIEERILDLQRRKRELSDSLLDKPSTLSTKESRYLIYGNEEESS